MNVSTILITEDEARRKLEQYKSIITKKRVAEDDKLQSLYASVVKGARVLNLAGAFRQAGLNELNQPKLAIARADWPVVRCVRNPYLPGYNSSRGTVGFTHIFKPRGWMSEWDTRRTATNIVLPNDTFTFQQRTGVGDWGALRSPVPHIPPDCRPKYGLHNYHILFEVERWEREYPVDPFLLRRISGMLYVVEAEWELTELEASLLSSMAQGT